jgi:hypothetical protein
LAQLTCNDDSKVKEQINLPLGRLEAGVPPRDETHGGNSAQGNTGTSHDPPSNDIERAYGKGSKVSVLLGCEDVGEVILALLRLALKRMGGNGKPTPDEGKAEASSDSPRVTVHWMKPATMTANTTAWGPPAASVTPKQLV